MTLQQIARDAAEQASKTWADAIIAESGEGRTMIDAMADAVAKAVLEAVIAEINTMPPQVDSHFGYGVVAGLKYAVDSIKVLSGQPLDAPSHAGDVGP